MAASPPEKAMKTGLRAVRQCDGASVLPQLCYYMEFKVFFDSSLRATGKNEKTGLISGVLRHFFRWV
jgi:hypothetical protein